MRKRTKTACLKAKNELVWEAIRIRTNIRRITKAIKILSSLSCILICTYTLAAQNTPGRHTIVLSWSDASAPSGTTYNLYRSIAPTAACTGVSSPTPLVTGVTQTTYTDAAVTPGTTYNYNVSAVSNSTGGESACDTELLVVVPAITTPVPTGLSAIVHSIIHKVTKK